MRTHLHTLLVAVSSSFLYSDAFNSRVKRHEVVEFESSLRDSVIEFEFLGTEYIVDLTPNHAAFHANFVVHTSEGVQKTPKDEYIAIVRDPNPGKGVLTKLEDDVYIGVINFHNDTLYLEPSYLHDNSKNAVFGYLGSDVEMQLDLSTLPTRNQVSFRPENPFIKLRREIRIDKRRRSDIQNEKRNRCSLKLVADYSFYTIIGKNNTGIVTKFLVNMIARVNEIYNQVNWDLDKEELIENRGRFENMGFSIKEIKVLDRPNVSDSHYNSYNKLWEANALLKEFAFAEGSKDFCLVHLVTARTFVDFSTLGLAYLSYKTWDETAGGICSKRETFDGKIAYINVLLTTSFAHSDQSTYPLITKEIDIVVSHEYGHAWGANHDPTIGSSDPDVAQCSPGSQDGGSFIMNPYAQNGYESNNVIFSPCSRRTIRDVLSHKWETCFEAEMMSFCGNGIVEETEECDNGIENDSSEISCCDKFCQLKVNAQCSPLNHICCTKTCQFQNSSHVCLPGDPLLCKADAVCNGYSGECPSAPPVDDGRECIDNGECSNGVCVPYCQKKSIGMKSCICEDLDLSCRRCCRDQNGTCSPVSGFSYLRDGVKCSKGTCRDKKCVNEVVDNVRNYFLAQFQDSKQFVESLKSMLVFFVVIGISLIFCPIYCLVSHQEQHALKGQIQQPAEKFRRVHIAANVPPPPPRRRI